MGANVQHTFTLGCDEKSANEPSNYVDIARGCANRIVGQALNHNFEHMSRGSCATRNQRNVSPFHRNDVLDSIYMLLA